MCSADVRQRVVRPSWWAWVVVLFLPALALAQISVEYQTLTLVESAYLYSGLALQSILRLSSLRQLPQIIIACSIVWLVYRRMTTAQPQPLAGVVAYVVSCSVILVLFWPEAAPKFFTPLTTRVFPGAVTSYVAQRNFMTVDNAGASRLVPASLVTAGGAPVPRFFDLLLRVATTVPLRLAERIDPGGLERPFQRIPALDELMNQDVPDSLTSLMPDFANLCYKPAAMRAVQNPGLTVEDLVPWSTGMGTILSGINISTESGIIATAKKYLPSLFGGTTVTDCKALYDGMQASVSTFLGGEATQQSSNKQQQYLDVLGMTAQSQAQFFVHRELQKHLTPAVNDPNRVVNYRRAVDAASFVTGAVGGFDLTAWGKSTAGQVEKQLDRISRFLGTASFLVHWAPYIVGFGIFTTLSFFPIVLIWSLFPGQHFKPLVNYFLLLVFMCSTPLWWAMVNVGANLAHNNFSPGVAWFAAIPGWGAANQAYVIVSVVGIVMVPIIQAILLFGTWRAIGGIWHG